MPRILPLSLLLLTAFGSAHAAPTPITIEQAMADPDWIGPPVESAWWSWNGQQVEYTLKRKGSAVRDTFRLPSAGGVAQQVADDQRGTLDAASRVYDSSRQRMAFVRNGDVFVRDLRSGALTQLTRSNERASGVNFATDGGVIWNVANNWFHWDARSGVTRQVAQLKADKNPADPPKADTLRDQQMRTLATLRNDRAQREELRDQGERWRQADPTRAPAPVFLGGDVEIVDSVLSPDARHLVVATKPKGYDEGRGGKMPLYVTESGYEEAEDTRTRVGRDDPAPNSFWLVDAVTGKVQPLALDGLPGITTDPLAELRRKAGKDALKGNRPVEVMSEFMGGGIRWNADGSQAAIMLRAIDNKDRWIATTSATNARLELQRFRLAARWPHAVAAVRGIGLFAPVHAERQRQAQGVDLGQLGNLGTGGQRGRPQLLLPVQPEVARRLRSLQRRRQRRCRARSDRARRRGRLQPVAGRPAAAGALLGPVPAGADRRAAGRRR
jgi:hypothetical protein